MWESFSSLTLLIYDKSTDAYFSEENLIILFVWNYLVFNLVCTVFYGIIKINLAFRKIVSNYYAKEIAFIQFTGGEVFWLSIET